MTVAANWPDAERDRIAYLRWLRDAFTRLAMDAQQWFVDEPSTLHDAIREAAAHAQVISGPEVQASVLHYNQLRSSLLAEGTAAAPEGDPQSAVRSAPLIDAAVPWVTTSNPAPSDSLSGTSWGAAIAQARRIYPADDATRAAVEQWAEEYRTGAAEHASDAPWNARFGRLLAFVRGRMRGDDTSNLGRTGPTAPMPADAGGLAPRTIPRSRARAPSAASRSTTPAARQRGGAWIILVLATVAGGLRKRRGVRR